VIRRRWRLLLGIGLFHAYQFHRTCGRPGTILIDLLHKYQGVPIELEFRNQKAPWFHDIGIFRNNRVNREFCSFDLIRSGFCDKWGPRRQFLCIRCILPRQDGPVSRSECLALMFLSKDEEIGRRIADCSGIGSSGGDFRGFPHPFQLPLC